MKERAPETGECPKRVGSIEVITGGMFSGKSEELIDRLKKAIKYGKQKVQIFTPKLDTRYGIGSVNSHNGTKLKATTVDEDRPGLIVGQVDEDTDIVAIDEGQFWGKRIVAAAWHLRERGYRVLIAGLDMDFRGVPFGYMPELMAIANKVEKRVAYCDKCGRENATRTQRQIERKTKGKKVIRPASYKDPIVLVGGKRAGTNLYGARCDADHEVPDKPKRRFVKR